MSTLPSPWVYECTVRVAVNFPSGQENSISHYSTVCIDDPIIEQWDLLHPQVGSIVKSLPWAVLSVVCASYPEPPITISEFSKYSFESNPIILVGAPVDSKHFWQDMAEKIYAICSNAGLGHVRVLFEDVQYPLVESDPETSVRRSLLGFNNEYSFLESNCMGLSFGPIGMEYELCASMGGTIKLQENDEEPSEMLLSVFHPFSDLVNENERANGWSRASAQTDINLSLPSVEDMDHSRRCRISTILEQLDRIEYHETKYEYTGDQHHEMRAAEYRETYDTEQAFLQNLIVHDDDNLGSGYLEYGSGTQCGLDWSLSSFNHCKTNNTLPTADELQALLKDASNDTKTVWSNYCKSWGQIHLGRLGKDDHEMNSHVFKRGRTSGLTIGRLSPIPSEMFDKALLKFQNIACFELQAVLADSKHPFSDKGDSGAWILNKDGDWIGSIVGDYKSINGRCISLFVEARKIVDNIEAFTGKKVVSPPRR